MEHLDKESLSYFQSFDINRIEKSPVNFATEISMNYNSRQIIVIFMSTTITPMPEKRCRSKQMVGGGSIGPKAPSEIHSDPTSAHH